MEQKNLVVGLKFASKHELTLREMQTLIPFLEKNYTRAELAKELSVLPVTISHIIQRLKMKGMLVWIESDDMGNKTYGFNTRVLDS